VKAVDHILRGHDQPDHLADRDMQLVDLALAAGVLDLPHPLLADDVDFLAGCRRLVEPEIGAGAPDEEDEEADEGGARPGDLPMPAFLGAVAPFGAAAAAKAKAVEEDEKID